MAIGIICAMDGEVGLLQQDIQSERVERIAGREFHVGTLYGQQVVLVMGRIGKVAASLTAGILMDHFQVESVIFSGTAGGVSPDMNVGDVVIADLNVQHDFKLPWGELFRIPMIEKSYIESDPKLTAFAAKVVQEYVNTQMLQDIPRKYLDLFQIKAPKMVVGTIASGDEFVCTKEKNEWLYEHVKNIKCVEMEGAAVAQACYEFGVPFAVIRIVSDSANNEAHVDFDLFIEEAARYFTRGTIKALLTRIST